jgi:hypothetical protein
MCQNWKRDCCVCPNHNPVVSSFMIYHGVYNELPFQNTWVYYRFLVRFMVHDVWFLVRFMVHDVWFSIQCFVHHCLSFCPFSIGRWMVYSRFLNPSEELSGKTQTQALLDYMLRRLYDIYIYWFIRSSNIEYNSVHGTLLECFEIYICKRVLIARTLFLNGKW